jgi:hypothetical protein
MIIFREYEQAILIDVILLFFTFGFHRAKLKHISLNLIKFVDCNPY